MRISAQLDNHSWRKRVPRAENGHFLILYILHNIGTKCVFRMKTAQYGEIGAQTTDFSAKNYLWALTPSSKTEICWFKPDFSFNMD